MTVRIFADTETTGLDPELHEVWEIAWAHDVGEVESAVVPHTLVGADPAALAMNGYFKRGLGHGVATEASLLAEGRFRADLTGAVLVGANPSFDARFLAKRWGTEPWQYRMLDIEAYAMGALGWMKPRGLKDIRVELVDRYGVEIPEPDHSAAGDVATLRACFHFLERLYATRGFV